MYDDFDYKPRDYGSLKVDNSPILPTFNSVKKEFDPINVLDTLKKENSKIKMYDDFDYKPHDFNNLKSNKETTIPILNHLKKEKEDVFIPMNFEKKSYTPKTIMPEYIIPKPVTPDPVIIEPYIPKPIIQEPIKIEPKIKNYIDLIQDTVPNIKTDNDFKIQPIKTKPTINYLNNDLNNDFDYEGSLGKSLGRANYIKVFPNNDKLSVHAPKGIITGAKFNEEPINNYQAAMFDLRTGIIKKNTGGKW